MLDDQPLDGRPPSPLDREDPDHAVALEDAEDDHFPGSAPAALPLAVAAKHRLIALDLPRERLGAFFGDAQHLPDDTKELFNRGARSRAAKAQAIRGYAEHEVIEQLQLGALAQT